MKYFPIYIIAFSMFLISCEKDVYLVDGGVSEAQLGMSTFDFLKSHDQLDTLALLVEKAGLVEEVNSTGTLFAPNDLSIKNYVDAVLTEMRKLDPQALFTVDDISLDTLNKYMGGYLFSEMIRREDLTKEGTIYTAINGDERRISLEPSQSLYNNNLSEPPKFVYFTYKSGDEWDEWDSTKDDDKIIVRTSNLESTNGMIHVLQGGHTLFNYNPE